MTTRKAPLTYEFACRNLYPDCDTKLRGDTEEEVLNLAKGHVSEHHGIRDYEDDVVRSLRTWIRPAV